VSCAERNTLFPDGVERLELGEPAMDKAVPRHWEVQHKTKIIVAEDEALVPIVLADALRHEDFEVIEAVDANDAISALKYNPDVALVVSDIRMRSVDDGMVLARYLRTHHAGVALVLTSAYPPPLKENVFDAFFLKPYEPEAIVRWIRRNIKSDRAAL
jgi:CheY-like chemotaxis protein